MGEIRSIEHTAGPNADYPVICLQGGGVTSRGSNGNGWEYDICYTLNVIDVHGVMYESDKPGGSPNGLTDKD